MIKFIQKYFIDPIYQHSGYNVVNTIAYGLLLGAGIILSDYLFAKLKLKVDRYFMFSVLPFLVLASSLRSLVDANLLPTTFFLITPGIFLTVFFLVLASLTVGRFIQEQVGVGYYKVAFSIGLALVIYPALLLMKNILIIKPILYILAAFFISSSAVIAIISFLNIQGFKEQRIYWIILAHLLDVSATFAGVEYFGYWEEHVFENFLIEKAGTALILFPFKIIAIFFIISILQKLLREESRDFWYFALFVLGLAPGLRDTFTIMLVG